MTPAGAGLQADSEASGWAGYAIPWLMSASLHCVLLIALGICVSLSQNASSDGLPEAAGDSPALFTSAQVDQGGDYYDDEESSSGSPGPEKTASAAGTSNSAEKLAEAIDGTADTASRIDEPLAGVLASAPIDF